MSERETMEYDVIVVGAGPAGLSFAIRLKQLQPDTSICVIEKASTIGAQILSGAVIETGPLDALLPEWRKNPPPICVDATEDEFWLLGKTGGRKLPVPPGMNNHGNVIVSLGAMCAWLAPQAEALGVDVFPGFAAADTIYNEDGSVAGVRIGDMGVAKDGTHKAGYTQGIDIKAKVTVLAEGARGSLTKQLIKRYALDQDSDPQGYSIGIKELWQLPAGRVTPGKIVHSFGWPADTRTYGGSFLYHLDGDRVALGYVSGLDYTDPNYQPWEAFQQWKNHPMMKPLLEGGTILSAGARAIVTGGYQSLPKVEMPGALLIGDTAGLLTEHEEDQPIHLHVADTSICVTKCAEEYGNPCARFCPANVYEIVNDEAGKHLQINAANCVHCKTCDIKDPYQIINWVTPEGGSGPNYQNM